MAEITSSPSKGEHIGPFKTKLLSHNWLSEIAFERHLKRPPSFRFEPGQRIRLCQEGLEGDEEIYEPRYVRH